MTKQKSKPKNPGGRPRTEIKIPAAGTAPKQSRRRYSLADHKDINKIALSCLEDQIRDANELIEYAKNKRDMMLAAVKEAGKSDSTTLRHLDNAEKEYRQAVKDRRQLWLSLLELLKQLAKPAEDDPLYTPVHLYINLPTPDVVAPPKYAPPDEAPAPSEDSSDV